MVVLKNKPKQFQDTVKKLKELLSKIHSKISKSKEQRMMKKERVKEKMESGEYLPKDVYEVTRQHKREKVLKDQRQGEKRREKQKFNKKVDSHKAKKSPGKKEEKAIPEKTEIIKRATDFGFKKQERDRKKHSSQDKSQDTTQRKGRIPVDIKAYKAQQQQQKEQRLQEKYAKPTHPSWEAKKQERAREFVEIKPQQEIEFNF